MRKEYLELYELKKKLDTYNHYSKLFYEVNDFFEKDENLKLFKAMDKPHNVLMTQTHKLSKNIRNKWATAIKAFEKSETKKQDLPILLPVLFGLFGEIPYYNRAKYSEREYAFSVASPLIAYLKETLDIENLKKVVELAILLDNKKDETFLKNLKTGNFKKIKKPQFTKSDYAEAIDALIYCYGIIDAKNNVKTINPEVLKLLSLDSFSGIIYLQLNNVKQDICNAYAKQELLEIYNNAYKEIKQKNNQEYTK